MKHFLFYCFFIFSIPNLNAQKIEKFFDYNWKPLEDSHKARFYALIEKKDSLWSRTDFYLREGRLQMQGMFKDQDCKIEHGDFIFYYANGLLQSKGNYLNGKKNGLWLSYHNNGMMSDSVVYVNGWVMGTRIGWHSNGFMSDSSVTNPDGSGIAINWFDNGNPSAAGRYAPGHKLNGKWQFFHSNGQLSALETFTNDVLTDKEYFDEKGVRQSDTTNKDREAAFPGGLKAWQKYLQKQLYFPSQYKFTNGDEAVVIVDWMIDEEGKTTDVRGNYFITSWV